MDLKPQSPPQGAHPDREALASARYARCVEIGIVGALAVVAIELLLYLSGALTPHVPLRELPSIWGLPVRQYLATAKVSTGWGWIELVREGDYLNFVGIVLLASVTAACFVRVTMHYLAERDRLYAMLAAAQLVVLLAAASGFIGAAH